MNNAALDTFWFRIRMFYPVILITTLILGIWAGGWLVAFEPGFLQGHTTQPLSDVFSSVNALFAGLAFCGLIATIYLQYRDMEGAKKQRSCAAAHCSGPQPRSPAALLAGAIDEAHCDTLSEMTNTLV